jgi:ATP-dependent Lhr-like helicase
MSDPEHEIQERLALKKRLSRTWSAFFSRHGNFRAAQIAAIPAVLDGANIMLCAPTASGKTEAILPPLIERHLPADYASASLAILYLTPTKALVNDLQARLAIPLETLRIRLDVKTRDVNTLNKRHPPQVLISTPESCDSLLTTQAALFANVRAIVIDELHLFDGTPRGDQLRVLLNRIRHIRSYAASQGAAPDATVQYGALSASLPRPEEVAARYFPNPQVIKVEGARPIQIDLIALDPDNTAALHAYFETFHSRGWRKALVFCNSRREVESYAAAVRERSPFGDAVFVHYSNLEGKRRHEIEQRFGALAAAVCFATSTLELGIDIGSIDVILLIGAPGSTASFVQRAGRGSRRKEAIHVCCFYRTALEKLTFEALHMATDFATTVSVPHPFRPSVAIQQTFSLIKQSPKGSVRMAELTRMFAEMLDASDVAGIIAELESLRYLQVGRPGEWRVGERLNLLADQQSNPYQSLSLHSNVKGSTAPKVAVRDQHSGQTVAHVDAQWLAQTVFTLEGRAVNVEWSDGESVLVRAAAPRAEGENLRFISSRQVLTFDLAQRLPIRLGLNPGDAPLVQGEDGWLWFHWLGDIYGTVLRKLIAGHVPVKATEQLGICLLFPDGAPHGILHLWTDGDLLDSLDEMYRQLEPMLDLGPFHHLLSAEMRRRTVIEQFDPNRFQAACNRLTLYPAEESFAAILVTLTEG